MNRVLTSREKALLVILAVLLIGISYYRFLLVPINDSVAQYEADAAAEQDMILAKSGLLQEKKQMEQELEALFAAGDPVPMPQYDNSGALLLELNAVLKDAVDYTLTFGDVTELEGMDIYARPVSLSMQTKNYAQARGIIDALHDSDNINVISDLSMEYTGEGDGEYVDVTLYITYFEGK